MLCVVSNVEGYGACDHSAGKLCMCDGMLSSWLQEGMILSVYDNCAATLCMFDGMFSSWL